MLSQHYCNLYTNIIGGTKPIMTGGTRPNLLTLKNIDLFDTVHTDMDKEEMRHYLNPFFGFIWASTNIIENIWAWKGKSEFKSFVKKIYAKIRETVQPVKAIFFNNEIDCEILGEYIGNRYLHYIYYPKNEEIQKIKKFIETTERCLQKCLQLEIAKSKTDNDIKEKVALESHVLTLPSNTNKEKGVIKNINTKIKSLTKTIERETRIYNEGNEKFVNYMNQLFPDNNNNYKQLLKTRIEECKRRITLLPIYKPLFNHPVIDNYITTFSGEKEYFYVLLSVMWFMADNKEGVADYYKGLNKAFEGLATFTIPETFYDNYKINELSESSTNFYDKITYIYYYVRGAFDINYQEYANVKDAQCNAEKCTYPDCGISSLRTFLRLWMSNINNDNLNIDKLREKGATEELLTYFSTFNTNVSQMSKSEKEIFGQKLNARDAWAIVTSSKPDVKYLNSWTRNGSPFMCEIDCGFPNMMRLIRNLLPGITDISDFDFEQMGSDTNYLKIKNIDIDVSTNLGTITIESGFGNFKWDFLAKHFSVKKVLVTYEISYDFTSEYDFYIPIIGDNIGNAIKHHKKLSSFSPYWYKFYDFNNIGSLITMQDAICDDGDTFAINSEQKNTLDLDKDTYNELMEQVIKLGKEFMFTRWMRFIPELLNTDNKKEYINNLFTIDDDKLTTLEKYRNLNDSVTIIPASTIYLLPDTIDTITIYESSVMYLHQINYLYVKKLYVHNCQTLYGLYNLQATKEDYLRYNDTIKYLYINNITNQYKNDKRHQLCKYNEQLFYIINNVLNKLKKLHFGPNCDLMYDYNNSFVAEISDYLVLPESYYGRDYNEFDLTVTNIYEHIKINHCIFDEVDLSKIRDNRYVKTIEIHKMLFIKDESLLLEINVESKDSDDNDDATVSDNASSVLSDDSVSEIDVEIKDNNVESDKEEDEDEEKYIIYNINESLDNIIIHDRDLPMDRVIFIKSNNTKVNVYYHKTLDEISNGDEETRELLEGFHNYILI